MFRFFAKSVLIYGIASSIGKFIGFFLVPIYTRVFSPEQYGIIDLISTVVSFLAILGMLQLESAISRYYYEAKDNYKRIQFISTAFWTIAVSSVLWTVLTLLFAKTLSIALFNTPEYKNIILLASFIIPVSNLFGYFTVIMRFLKKPVHFTIIVLTQILASVGISIWLVVIERIGVIGVFIGQLSGFFIGCVVMLIYLRSFISLHWNKRVLIEFFRYSLPLVPSVAGTWINSYANRFIMLGYLTVTDIGLYTVALKISSVFALFQNAFSMAWGPYFWETLKKPEHKEIYKKLSIYVTVIVFAMVVIFAFFAKELLILLTTDAYIAAAPLVGLLAFSAGITMVNPTIGVGPQIVKKTEYVTGILLISVMVNVGSLFILVPYVGLIGVPISLLIGSIAMFIISWYISEKLYFIGFYKLKFILIFISTLILVGIVTFMNIILSVKIIFLLIILSAVMIYLKRNPALVDQLKKDFGKGELDQA
ncbi:oligosaccharide flippase family protein [Bacteroidales bacterium AH-315-N07]|nr:oligosaccharide flippase family protein [Bacteroidales bacterium AH-315-N07]